MRRIVIFDYGSGNIRSAERAFARVGASVEVTRDADLAAAADGLVLPGVGAFAACMAQLSAARGVAMLRERVRAGRPILGICVGMQVLFDSGDERGVVSEGLGLLRGNVARLHASVLPHMGWNTVVADRKSFLFAGLPAETRFYFVHSYAASHADGLVTTARHGEQFIAAVEHGPVAATQFHPEKSGDAGAEVLSNWLKSAA